ncbi:hypothetical protein EWB00_005038 [Schistosoma japonicum]|uniref:SJCHGC02803 protein n=1 Tax=Schistosoma japonicum TaxID=6182 RepID=Q5DHT7_SCHJA|nr:SJCHGC02803 protein [Schistosoma japonicum]ABL86196.1 unknown [Schistosoma japonicum]KAH8854842.1 hypothetical protein KSF78_0001814 [Schistosoma japonicum]TNN10926.1 hypothetical protein EWB00_005038 [Schistosoma japonicum]CAX82980.1 hypothetical protein [Schistosoma japonicum]
MKVIILLCMVYTALTYATLISKVDDTNKKNDDAAEVKKEDKDENEEGETDEDEGESKRGMKAIYKVLKKSYKTGRKKICKTFDKYLRKDDLDKKMLEIANILAKRLEKRMEYLSQSLADMLTYETS